MMSVIAVRWARPSACSPAPIWPNMAGIPASPLSCASSTTFCSARRPSSPAFSSMRSWWCRWAISRAGPAPLSLTVIVIPVVVRTTENMLLLVPNGLREAASALGAPMSFVIRAVTWKSGPGRHHHRRAAGDRAHFRRDRAAAFHRPATTSS